MAYDMKINDAALESGAPFPVPDAQHGEVDEPGFETKEANNRRHRRLACTALPLMSLAAVLLFEPGKIEYGKASGKANQEALREARRVPGVSLTGVHLNDGSWKQHAKPVAAAADPDKAPTAAALGETWSVPPLLGPSKPITHSWASPLCGQLAASVDAHGAFFSGRAVRRLELENPRLAPLVL